MDKQLGSILGPLIFNIFMNDLSLFIKKCQLCNYTDGNSLDSSSEKLTGVLYNLRYDGSNMIEWFDWFTKKWHASQIVPFHKDFSSSGKQLEHRKLAHEL